MTDRPQAIRLLCAAALLLAGGCVTPALLEAVDPNEKRILSRDRTTEEELQRRGLSYTVRDNYFVVEKTPWQKAGDYALLGIGLPCAAAADTALVAWRVCYALSPFSWFSGDGPGCPPDDPVFYDSGTCRHGGHDRCHSHHHGNCHAHHHR